MFVTTKSFLPRWSGGRPEKNFTLATDADIRRHDDHFQFIVRREDSRCQPDKIAQRDLRGQFRLPRDKDDAVETYRGWLIYEIGAIKCFYPVLACDVAIDDASQAVLRTAGQNYRR
jgi:hypothetical protein